MGQARGISIGLIESLETLEDVLEEVWSNDRITGTEKARVRGALLAHGGNVTVVHRRIKFIQKATTDCQDIRGMRETSVLAGFREDALDYVDAA